MMSPNRYTIGGEFELDELPIGSHIHLSKLTRGLQGTWTTSGRAALFLILKRLKDQGVSHVHLPAFLCASILLPLKSLGFTLSFYPVDVHLVGHPDPPKDAAVFVIHYFGWPNLKHAQFCLNYGMAHDVIEDVSQAMLSTFWQPKEKRHFVLFSPRKFGPLGLGGWCNLNTNVAHPSLEVEGLAWRSVAARLARGAYLKDAQGSIDGALESVYLQAFQAVETFLDHNPAEVALPQIVLDMIAGLNWQAISETRRQNWLVLHEALEGHFESVYHTLPDEVTPLGYVVRLKDRNRVRKALQAQRIFCPVHWPLPDEVDSQKFSEAYLLSQTCLTLPIDQRYKAEDMLKLAKSLKAVSNAL